MQWDTMVYIYTHNMKPVREVNIFFFDHIRQACSTWKNASRKNLGDEPLANCDAHPSRCLEGVPTNNLGNDDFWTHQFLKRIKIGLLLYQIVLAEIAQFNQTSGCWPMMNKQFCESMGAPILRHV